jgi:hypothetical protein
MPEYPIVVREIAGKNRLGVEDADGLEADLRPVISEGYERVDVESKDDGERVGTVVAASDRPAIEEVRWTE